MKRCNMWRRLIIPVAMVVLTLGSGCKKAAQDPFPASGAVAGWQKTDATRVFEAKDLWQYIDGDAEHFIQAGVVSTSTADYTYNGNLEAVVDIHTMGGSDGAEKILQTGLTRDAKTVQLGDQGVQYTQSVSFRKGRYVVRIVAYEATPDAPEALMALARGIEQKL